MKTDRLDTSVERVIFSGMTDSTPPRLLFRKGLKQTDGKNRPFTEAVLVPDEPLQTRIASELQINDEIELSVAYDYSAPGWPSHVLDFRKANLEKVTADNIPQSLTAA